MSDAFAPLQWTLLEARLAEEGLYPMARAALLAGPLECPRAAVEAAQSALSSAGTDLTPVLLLMQLALHLDDEGVARSTWAHTHTHLCHGALPPVESGALALTWALIWTLRWPDAERAAQALEVATPYDSLRLGDLLTSLTGSLDERIARARHRLEGAVDADDRARGQLHLGRLLLSAGDLTEGAALVDAAVSSGADLDEAARLALWHRLEVSWRTSDALGMPLIEALARTLPPSGAGALWHLAADLLAQRGEDARAERLYARAAAGPSGLVIALKRLHRALSDPSLEPARHANRLHDAVLAGADTGLDELLSIRSAELCLEADLDARTDLDVSSASDALARVRWHQRRWSDLRLLVDRRPPSAAVSIFTAALDLMALKDAEGCTRTLLDLASSGLDGDDETTALMGWRLRQLAGDDRGALRAEADRQPDLQRRVSVLVQLVHAALADPSARLDAHVALEAALGLDPRHPTALLLGVELGRQSGRPGPWAEALTRAIMAFATDGTAPGPLGQALIHRLAALSSAAPKVARFLADEHSAAMGSWLDSPTTADQAVEILKAGERYVVLEDLLRQASERSPHPLHRARLLAHRGQLLCDFADRPAEGGDLIQRARALIESAPPSESRTALQDWMSSWQGGESAHTVVHAVTQETTRVAGTTPDEPEAWGSTVEAPAMPSEAASDPQPSSPLGPARRTGGARSRAAVRRRLARAKSDQRGAAITWPDLGRMQIRNALDALSAADDAHSRAEAAAEVAEQYEAAEAEAEAIAAWREVLAWRSGSLLAIERLLVLCTRRGDWKGLAQTLQLAIDASGDTARRQQLILSLTEIYTERLHDPASAVPHLRRALSERPGDQHLVTLLAATLKGARMWSDYVQVVTASGQIDAHPEVALEVGQVLLHHLDDPQRAAPLIERVAPQMLHAVDEDTSIQLLRDLATVRAVTGALDEAMALLDRAITMATPSQALALRLSQAQLVQSHGDDPAQALALYRRALGEGLHDLALLEQAERLAIDLRAWGVLVEILGAMARQTADHADKRALLIRLGHLHRARLDEPLKAADCFVEAFELDPADQKLYRLIVGLVDADEDPQRVALRIRVHQAWLSAVPDPSPQARVEVARQLAAAYEAAEQPTDAARVLESVWHALGDDPAVHALLAPLERAYRRAGQWAELARLYTLGLSQNPSEARQTVLLRHLARVQETGLHDLVAATETWGKILTITPDDLSAVRALCRLLEAQRRWDELIEASGREFELQPDDAHKAHVLFRIGSLYETHLDDTAMAQQVYEQVLRLDHGHFPALHGLRALATAAEDWPAAIKWLQREADRWDKPREKAAVLAQIGLIERDKLERPHKAMATLMQAFELWPACVPAARALGDAAYSMQAWERAATFYQAVTTQKLSRWSAHDRAEIFTRRGLIALQLGNHHESAESLRIALEINADHPGALEALVEANGALEDPIAEGPDLRARVEVRRQTLANAGASVIERARVEILEGHLRRQALDLDGALEAYGAAITLAPDQLDLRQPLVDLLTALRRWPEATATLDALCVRLEDRLEDDTARAAYLEAQAQSAMLWGDFAVDTAQAEDRWVKVARVARGVDDRRHREARLAVAQGAFLEGDPTRALFLVERLLEDVTARPESVSGPELASIYAYAGVILTKGLDDQTQGAARLIEALKTDPRCAMGLLALLRLRHRQSGGTVSDELTTLLETHSGLIEACPARDLQHSALKIFAAELWSQIEPGKGRGLLEDHARGGPGARDARLALAHGPNSTVEAGANHLYDALEEDICDLDALRSLARLAQQEGDDDLELRVLEVLDLCRAVSGPDLDQLRQLQSKARRRLERGPRDPRADLRFQTLHHPGWSSPLIELVRLCEPLLLPLQPPRPRPQVRRNTALGPRSGHPFAAELPAVFELLGKPTAEVHGLPGLTLGEPPITVWPDAVPRIVFAAQPPEIAWTIAQQRFLLGRALCLTGHGLSILHDLSWAEAHELMGQLAQLFSANSSLEIDTLPPDRAERVEQLLHRDQHGGMPQPLIPRWGPEPALKGVTRTMDRYGLLTAVALRAAVGAMVRLKGSAVEISHLDTGDLTWALRSNPRVRDLVKFSLSEGYRQLRSAAGLALRARPE
ncbi:MAG: hypothetical protein ACE366_04195 [Bradymonadia bacterium]